MDGSVRACELPEGALLSRYVGTGAYTDCFAADVARAISHAEYVEAFYTTAVFKLERLVLSWQLLLCDLHGRTRSWLMSVAAPGHAGTRLYFGSAVVPIRDERTGESTMGGAYRALLGFHKLYSRILLRAAVVRLARQQDLR